MHWRPPRCGLFGIALKQAGRAALFLAASLFTAAEEEALDRVTRGLSNHQVDADLGGSHRTVDTHLSRIDGNLPARTCPSPRR